MGQEPVNWGSARSKKRYLSGRQSQPAPRSFWGPFQPSSCWASPLGEAPGRGLELGLRRGAGVPPALNLAWRSRSGLLSSSCVIREYFWDWQLQASLSLRPDFGGLLGTWRLEVGGRRGKRPWLWEGAGKAGSREQEARPQAGEAAGPLAGEANRKDSPP